MMTGNLTSEGLLLVQPAVIGKSYIPKTSSVVASYATIMIEPTLALSSDQYSKFNHTTSAQGVLAYSHQLYFQNSNEHRSILVSNTLTGLNKKKL